MGYMHIENLYKIQDILLFKECYALEKIHGTSAHISWNGNELRFFSGGESHEKFAALFDSETLKAKLLEKGFIPGREVIIYGEAYGGKQQGMSDTYGKTLKFIVFDVMVDNHWLNVPNADDLTKSLGLEFVYYVKVSTDLKELDAQRDAPSMQAIRNGISDIVSFGVLVDTDKKIEHSDVLGGQVLNPKKREGVVLRPLIELTKNNGARIICKHKGDEFRETATPRKVVDPAKMQILADAEKVADEWITPMRLQHILDKLPGHCMERMREIIAAAIEDVLREGSGEIVDSDAVRKAIGKKTAIEYKRFLQSKLAA